MDTQKCALRVKYNQIYSGTAVVYGSMFCRFVAACYRHICRKRSLLCRLCAVEMM